MTLAPHIYSSFMQYCPDSLLRWNVWKANRSRGSPGQDKDLSTSLHLEEIRFARRDQVKLLGYSSFADMSMETKMAGSVETVKEMIHSLMEKGTSTDCHLSFLYTRAFLNAYDLWLSRKPSTLVSFFRKKKRRCLFL